MLQMRPAFRAAASLVALFLTTSVSAQPGDLDQYDVTWSSPSQSSAGSMPIGNGRTGLNVWVEPDGALRMYVSSTDSWSQNNVLMKLGGLRVTLDPNPFAGVASFTQRLVLRDGVIVIRAGDEDNPVARLRVWVDPHADVVHVEGETAQASTMTVHLNLWRTRQRRFNDPTVGSWRSWTLEAFDGPSPELPEGKVATPDLVLDAGSDRLAWYHRNEHSMWALSLRLQGLGDHLDELVDPLLHRTFGGVVEGAGLRRNDLRTLRSDRPGTRHEMRLYAQVAQTPTPGEWLERLEEQLIAGRQRPSDEAFAANRAWWNAFWQRSYIFVDGDDLTWEVTRAYVLQRWVTACGGRGGYPIKFNGSIFTYDPKYVDEGRDHDPDYRNWGGEYWWQNTRLPYWPLLVSGDLDMLRPLFDMYGAMLPLSRLRNHVWHGCEGAYFPETASSWGAFACYDYGWEREGRRVDEVENVYVRYYTHCALELVMLMLDRYTFAPGEAFLAERLVPMAAAVMADYDTRFGRDASGRLDIQPTQALETWQEGVRNPTPEIAGLRAVLPRLLALPSQAISPYRARWQRLLAEVPDLPMDTDPDGQSIIRAAAAWTDTRFKNIENPELYPVFPYQLYGVGRPDLDVALRTWNVRAFRAPYGWQQNPVQAAMLGLAREAQLMLVSNAAAKQDGARFPAFWRRHYDWVPDQCHGGNIMSTLQSMILQHDGDRILLMPAWPPYWKATFRLHAPGETVVEGTWAEGRFQQLHVTPPSRADDVEVVYSLD